MSKFRYERSHDELLDFLKRQLGFLRSSAQAYDAGNIGEAERLATAVCIIVYDSGANNRSLLTQLGMRRDFKVIDSAHSMEIPKGQIGIVMPALCLLNTGSETLGLEPKLMKETGAYYHAIPLSKWWNGAVYRTRDGLMLKRMNLVIAMRNQDGGSHVDAILDNEAYHWMRSDFDPLIKIKSPDGTERPIRGAHWATMRQIAWELDMSFQAIGH